MVNTAAVQAPIGNGQTMNADAASHWVALVADLARQGVTVIATEGTRTYARQKQLYDGYRQGLTDPTTGKRYNPAWPPTDARANHLSGRAVDVGSSVGYVNTPTSKAFYARCGRYGFRPTVPGEPWHFEWHSTWVAADLNTASSDATRIPEPEENSMPVIIGIAGGGGIWVVDLAGKTKYNISVGLGADLEPQRTQVFKNLGMKYIENQPAWLLAGFTDITAR